jgi:hypothetical protein
MRWTSLQTMIYISMLAGYKVVSLEPWCILQQFHQTFSISRLPKDLQRLPRLINRFNSPNISHCLLIRRLNSMSSVRNPRDTTKTPSTNSSAAVAMSGCSSTHQPGTKLEALPREHQIFNDPSYAMKRWLSQDRAAEPWQSVCRS